MLRKFAPTYCRALSTIVFSMTSTTNDKLKLASWNCDGSLCYQLIAMRDHMISQNIDVLLVQESHCDRGTADKLQNEHFNLTILTNQYGESTGVTTLLNRSTVQSVYGDVLYESKDGRVLIHEMLIHGRQLILGNLYAPADGSDSRISFFSNFAEGLPLEVDIVGGD